MFPDTISLTTLSLTTECARQLFYKVLKMLDKRVGLGFDRSVCMMQGAICRR